MLALVTGASGRIGGRVVRDLAAHGWRVRTFDRLPLPPGLAALPGVEGHAEADMHDARAVADAVAGCDAVAHLAAVPGPGQRDDVLFDVNVSGTQHLFAACEAAGVGRVALASSCCAYGLYFAPADRDPRYLPLDEDHPLLPEDVYGLSKALMEATAAAYARRCGIAAVCLRLTTVLDLEGIAAEGDGAGEALLARACHGRTVRARDLWSYVDLRDAARSFRLALESPAVAPGECACLNIAAPDPLAAAEDVRELVRRFYPKLAPYAADLYPGGGLIDTRRAERAIGFVARHTWRDAVRQAGGAAASGSAPAGARRATDAFLPCPK